MAENMARDRWKNRQYSIQREEEKKEKCVRNAEQTSTRTLPEGQKRGHHTKMLKKKTGEIQDQTRRESTSG